MFAVESVHGKGRRGTHAALEAGLLAGITRAVVFELGSAVGVKGEEALLKDDDLYNADEAFFTSTT